MLVDTQQYKRATKQQERLLIKLKRRGVLEMELGNGWDMLGYVHAIHGRQPLEMELLL
jgi:hypothetical protein